MFFLKCFDVRTTVFGITLFGYGVFAIYVTSAESSQSITIPFRFFVLLSSIILFFHDVIISRNSLASINYQKQQYNQNKVVVICTSIFLFFYSCRLIYSLYISDEILSLADKSQYIMYWFFMCLIPGINFLFLGRYYSSKYMYVTWVTLALVIVPALFVDVSISNFSSQGRLATAAINPITLGHYATSLFLLSFYMILNKNQDEALPAIANNTFVFLGTSLVGIIIAFSANSRGPLIALSICLILILVNYKPENKKNVKFLLFLIFSLVLFTIALSSSMGDQNNIFDKFFLSGNELDPEDQRNRGYAYNMAIKLSLEHPFIGFGLELPDGHGYPHNLFLESFLSLGFCGGILFFTVTVYTIITSIKLLATKNPQLGWIGILFIQYTIGGCFSGSLYAASSFWYLLFAVLGVSTSVKNIGSYNNKDKFVTTAPKDFSSE
jgi:O-Antigen ligase